jgi:hypothetical protein
MATTMPDVVRCFNDEGISEFSRWIRGGAIGPVPTDLLPDSAFSVPMANASIPEIPVFKDRYEFGVFLVNLLSAYDPHQISYNAGLWTWLAALFFEQLAPANVEGKRSLRRPYVYVLSETRKYYRHLVRGPWYLVRTHGAEARYLLAPVRTDDSAPLSRQSDLLDQLAARQFVISSPTLIATARLLYTDPRTGRQRRGTGARGKGSPRRLALIANQLALTYDVRKMSVEQFMKILPQEFR